MAKLVELIVTNLTTVGSGVGPESPRRRILEIYDKEGNCVASSDPCGIYSLEDMLSFARHWKSDAGPDDIVAALRAWEQLPPIQKHCHPSKTTD